MSNMLITGGAGFLGSALCNRLAEQGHNVLAFDNFSRSSHMKEKLYTGVETWDGDVRNKEQLQQAAQSCKFDALWHLAYVNGTERFYKEPELVLDVAVKGAINTIDVALDSHISRYILASTSEVYNEPTTVPTTEYEPMRIPNPHNPRFSYSSGKMISEMLAIHYGAQQGLETVIFRPHNIYGANAGQEHVIPELIKKMLLSPRKQWNTNKIVVPIQGTGNETRAFCYIDDAIDGIILAGTHTTSEKAPIFNIGTDEETRIIDLAHKIAAILGVDIEVKPSEKLDGSSNRRCPDITKIKGLGYTPKTSLDEGLAKTVAWYKELYNSK